MINRQMQFLNHIGFRLRSLDAHVTHILQFAVLCSRQSNDLHSLSVCGCRRKQHIFAIAAGGNAKEYIPGFTVRACPPAALTASTNWCSTSLSLTLLSLLCPLHSGVRTLLLVLPAFFQQHMTDGGICRWVGVAAVVPPFWWAFILVFDPADCQYFLFHTVHLTG